MGASKPVLIATFRLRFLIGFIILLLLLFEIIALSGRSKWASSTIDSTSTNTTPIQFNIACQPPDAVNATTCTMIQTATTTGSVHLEYGLFKDIIMTTTTQVTTRDVLVVDDAGKEEIPGSSNTTVGPTITSKTKQTTYEYWRVGSGGRYNNVRGSQCFLVLAFLCTCLSATLLVWAMHGSSTKKESETELKMGFYLFLFANFCLFLTFTVWCGIGDEALTTFCNWYAYEKSVGCTNYSKGLCANSTDCEVTSLVVDKTGPLWGLVLFSWFLHTLALCIWRRLYQLAVVVGVEGQGGSTLGQAITQGQVPAAIPEPYSSYTSI